jgi:Xaa-Pro aminopeptidase
MKTTAIKIPEDEYIKRIEVLRNHIKSKGSSGVVLFDNYYLLYYCGFAFIPTERPIVFVMNAEGEKGLFVPRLELEHAQSNAVVDRVDYYDEYPSENHPMQVLKDMMNNLGIQKYHADHDGYPWIFGYQGPKLSELTNNHPAHIGGFIEEQMMIKSPAEIALVSESVKWGNLAHMLLQRYTQPGLTETEVSLRASSEATLFMQDAIGPIYRSQSTFIDGAQADYRGQIGRNAAIPHALAGNITFQEGDVLVTGANAPVWGYNSELERTMIIGPASDDQKRMYDHMLALQDIALAAILPGVPCSEVDLKVRKHFEDNNLMPYWKHHVGHAIGLRYHEGPFLDKGDHTEIKPGMIFTVEPGLYAPELGGFRHSDTVLVTEQGIELLTYYPRDLSSLTIPV